MTDPIPAHVQDAYDSWLDDSPHNVLLMSIADACWQHIAYDAAFAAYQAGRQVAITKTWNAAQATQRELIRKVLDRSKIEWLIHTLDLIDKLAKSRGLDTSSEAQDDLRKLADLLEVPGE